LQAENPELFQAILAEGAASVTLESLLAKQPEAAEKLRIEGETRERARAVEILEAEGDQAVTLAAVKAGTPAAETFKQFFRAEREGRDKALENLKASAPEPMGQKPPAETKGDFMDKVAELQASGEAQTKGQAVRLAAERFPDLHEAYVQNQQTKKK